ncbi:MAG: GDSL-type esterase/lipase family protein [Acidobacteriota bacterium]
MTPPPNPNPRNRLKAAAANLGLLAATVLLLLGIFEGTLRLSGFSYVLYPQDIEFGMPNPVVLKAGFQEDDDLFWVTQDYDAKLERLRRQRPTWVLLGDSCTDLGGYDEALAERAAGRGKALRYGNLGVAGWSSFQGRRQLERDVPPLGPEVVTIYFGWNDHWIGFGIDDANVARVKRVFSSRWSRLRLVQLATKTRVAWDARGSGLPNRVALPDFEANLRAMVAQARSLDAVPVLLTAPSNHEPGEEPAALGERWLRDVSELVPLHRAYVDAVRRVAGDTGAPLCDLARRFDALDKPQRNSLFMTDGIHPNADGDRFVASALDACFERDGLWTRLLGSTEPQPPERPSTVP